MAGRLRLLAVPLLLVLVPSAALGLIGYRWLRLERLQETQRSREAALAEGTRLREDVFARLAAVASETSRAWGSREAGSTPFASPPLPSDLVTAAYRFTPGGVLLYPDHDRAYRELVRRHEAAINRPAWRRGFDLVAAHEARGDVAQARRTLEGLLRTADGPDIEAALRLATGRLALEQGDLVAAEATARELLGCCSAVRDEYGVSFGLYAAAQLVAAWRRQGVLRIRFGPLAGQLERLLDQGVIGHPVDVPQIVSLAASARPPAEADALVARTREGASRISGQAAAGHELERWVAASTLVARNRQDMVLSTLFSDGQPRLVGVLREPGGQFLALSFSTDRLASWIAARASGRGRFEATLTASGAAAAAGAIRVALSPDTPGLDLVLRPPAVDPALQQDRTALLGGVFVAAFLLVLIVAWLTLRDISRELRAASLRANFVAGVTHELKTPLTSIRLLAETLRLKRTRDPAAADELLGAIVSESERLGQLLDNVLGFARIDRGEHPYRPADVDLAAAVDSALARLRYIVEQAEFRITVERSGGPLHVHADGEALTGAVANLLGNAVKYSGTSREIRVAMGRTGGDAELRVTDFGIGIAPHERSRVFERFYRAPKASREAAGAGLGLALVRHFAEAHGGQVTLTSEPDTGTTFTLRLPLVRTQEPGARSQEPGARIRIVTPVRSDPWPPFPDP